MNVGKHFVPRVRLSGFAAEQTITISSSRAILGILAIYGFSLVMMTFARVLPSVLTVPFIVLSLSFVPGALLLVILGRKELTVNAEHVLYAFGSSLVILMFVGAFANILLPFIGITKPLMPAPLGASVTAAVGTLTVVACWRSPNLEVSLRIPALWSPTPLAFLLLPLFSIIGVNLINATGITVLLVTVLLAISLVPIISVRCLSEQWYSLAIWTVALAILYHKSLWQYAGFGGRPHGIAAWEAGRWSPGVTSIQPYSSELVQNGVLFPLFAHLSDIFIITQYEVVNPFFVSFIPLALYISFRQYVRHDVAFLGAALFMFAHPFYLQYPTAGRAATPVLFLALFGVALSNQGLPSTSRAILVISFLTGIVVTHYATSYYVAAGFAVAVVLIYVLKLYDVFLKNRLSNITTAPNGGLSIVRRPTTSQRPNIFSQSTVLFFISAALGWYLYTRGGWKFDLLPKHVYQNLQSLLQDSTSTGRTAARVQENYTSLSIEMSKYIYFLVAGLIAIGILSVYYRRIVTGDRSFDDCYLAIAAALFGIFGSTTILRNWGGGRPMMITFSFTAVFAALAIIWITNGVNRISAACDKYLLETENIIRRIRRWTSGDQTAVYVFSVLLMVFLLLNTGVMAATVFGGLAPSNVPAQSALQANEGPQSQVTVHREIDIVTHVWLVEHLDDEHTVYGDTFGARQFDWYRPDIAARTSTVGGGYTSATKPLVFDPEKQRRGSQPGYILMMGHNVELGAVWESKSSSAVPIGNLSIDQRNRIYTTGESHIYFCSEPKQPPSTEDTGDE